MVLFFQFSHAGDINSDSRRSESTPYLLCPRSCCCSVGNKLAPARSFESAQKRDPPHVQIAQFLCDLKGRRSAHPPHHPHLFALHTHFSSLMNGCWFWLIMFLPPSLSCLFQATTDADASAEVSISTNKFKTNADTQNKIDAS